MKISYITVTKKILNVSRGTVHNWASSKKRPSVENAQKLESLYGFPMSSFLTFEREKVWSAIKSMGTKDLEKKLVSFFNKQKSQSPRSGAYFGEAIPDKPRLLTNSVRQKPNTMPSITGSTATTKKGG